MFPAASSLTSRESGDGEERLSIFCSDKVIINSLDVMSFILIGDCAVHGKPE